MALILCLETSTANCSVALFNNGELIYARDEVRPNIHAEKLTVFIQEAMTESGFKLSDLHAISVGKGPGSYTGLRIGVSVAKGLAYGLNKPLIAIPTLQSLASGAWKDERISHISTDKPVLVCPAIDARRMEIYTGFYNHGLEAVKPVSADIVDADSYSSWLSEYHLVFTGDGAEKCSRVLNHHATFHLLDGLLPAARFQGQLAEEAFSQQQFEDVVLFEPFYLKDFVGTVPKSGLL